MPWALRTADSILKLIGLGDAGRRCPPAAITPSQQRLLEIGMALADAAARCCCWTRWPPA